MDICTGMFVLGTGFFQYGEYSGSFAKKKRICDSITNKVVFSNLLALSFTVF